MDGLKSKKMIFFGVLLIILLSMSIVRKTFQNDTYFTITVGNKILSQGIYTDETFTFHQGLKYENVRWLFDIIIAFIYKMFNFRGIYIFTMIMTSIIGLTVFFILIKQNGSIYISFLFTLLVMYISKGVFAARAQIMSFFIFILEYYCIYQLLKTNKRKYSFLLFILSILLANIHASVYPLFYVLYLPYFAEAILSIIFRKNGIDNKIIIERRNNIITLFFTMIFSILGGFITPIGLAPFINMFKTIGEISTDIIAEMQPLNLYNSNGFIIYITIIMGILAFSKVKIHIVDCFYLLGFGLLSLSSIRSVYFFYLIGIFPLCNTVVSFLNTYSFNLNMDNKQIYCCIISISFIIILFSINNFSSRLSEDYVSTKEYPVDAVIFIKENIDINSMRLYNHFNNGSYLEFCGIPVFIDSRAEIYLSSFNNTNILADWNNSKNLRDYEKIFDKYAITHALIENESPMIDYISFNEKWEKIYQDDSFSIYRKVEI